MKAIVYTQYGSPDVLQLKELAKPAPREEEVLVKVHAASATIGDVILVKGNPFVVRFSTGLLKPKRNVPGKEMAGRVEAVGGNVKQFRPGMRSLGIFRSAGLALLPNTYRFLRRPLR